MHAHPTLCVVKYMLFGHFSSLKDRRIGGELCSHSEKVIQLLFIIEQTFETRGKLSSKCYISSAILCNQWQNIRTVGNNLKKKIIDYP